MLALTNSTVDCADWVPWVGESCLILHLILDVCLVDQLISGLCEFEFDPAVM